MLSLMKGGEKMKNMNQKNKKNKKNPKQLRSDVMYKANLTSCPICGATLKQDALVGSGDEFIIDCSSCGDYAISYEFYEDYINQPRTMIDAKKIATYLFWHKGENTVPCICECENTPSTKYRCITTRKIDRWYSEFERKKQRWLFLTWIGRISF